MTTTTNNEMTMNATENTTIATAQRAPRAASFIRPNWAGTWNNVDGEIFPISDIMHAAQCDYNVTKQPLIRVTPEMLDAIKLGLPIEGLTMNDIITTHAATSRTDTNHTMGVVGADYSVIQNVQAFEFIDQLQAAVGKESIIETAGQFRGGARAFVTCKIGKPNYLDDNGKDEVNTYIVCTTTHDGTGAFKIVLTDVRVVCQNTLHMALMKGQQAISYKHTKYVDQRIGIDNLVNRFFETQKMYSEHFLMQMRKLREAKISDTAALDFAANIYLKPEQVKLYLQANRKLDAVDEISTRAKNQIAKLMSNIESGIGQEMHRGSKLWLLNGLTTLLHNDTQYKSGEDEFQSILEGDGAKKLDKAYKALELIA